MNLLPGIVGIVRLPSNAAAEGMKTARYWRLDNIVYNNTIPQIYGLKFWKSGVHSVSTNALNPVTITTSSGEQTSLYNVSRLLGDSGTVYTITGITFFNFDFGSPVRPDRLEIWGWEWDRDCMQSFDISWSDDNSTWTKVGEWNADTHINRSVGDGGTHLALQIWSNEGLQISSPKITVIEGRKADAIFLNRPVITIIEIPV